jgi:hypothetical protein
VAQKQVGARTEGDVYQGLFFWREAAALLIPESLVIRVDLEHDEADGVDDVAVFYEEPGINAGGWQCMADYYQLKYHVDRRDSYSSEAMIDPTFIRARSSLLQRFLSAYRNLRTVSDSFRLHLVSNWRWLEGDVLAKLLREFDGAVPQSFFSNGPKSELGKIREKWRRHLRLESSDFEAFAKTLRFQLDHFGRQGFKEWVNDRLARVGLRIPPANHAACPYENLVQKFLMSGPNSFDRKNFSEMCNREELIVRGPDEVQNSREPTIGIRSFIRFAEHMEEEVDTFVCVVSFFEGRHPRNEDSWKLAASKILDFLSDPELKRALRSEDHKLLLECHGSLAFLAGYELSNNSGSRIYTVQKPGLETWKPNRTTSFDDRSIATKDKIYDNDGDDVAISLSLTHDIMNDVEDYISSSGMQISKLIDIQPRDGASGVSIKGPDHALHISDDMVKIFRDCRSKSSDVIHLFSSAPNAFMFFLGQNRLALGRIQLYEYDFGFERHCSYFPSMLIPFGRNPKTLEGK